jgi:hypothetical protein
MRRSIVWLIIGVPLALLAVAMGTAAASPTIRHIVSGFWNLPDRLPALPANGLVHYEQGADACASAVATLLPAAIARVEAVQGRPFARPVPIGVYATPDTYMAANGRGSMGPVGVTFLGRVNLSPALCSRQRQRLPAILTHELSHAHLQGWIGMNFLRLPNWFKEGLAVMVSEGGGAEFVSEQEARAAIRRGERIAIDEAGSLRNLVEVRFEGPRPSGSPSHVTLLAYRQAGMFVTFLHDSGPVGFARMMDAILGDRPFAEAVTTGYGADLQTLWLRFVQTASALQ